MVGSENGLDDKPFQATKVDLQLRKSECGGVCSFAAPLCPWLKVMCSLVLPWLTVMSTGGNVVMT